MAGYSDFFFEHLYTQIFIWDFAHCCLCQVKITTEQGNMKCRMWKKGHSITPTWVYAKVFQSNQ